MFGVNNLQAVVLAGGKGKRAFPLTANKPKPMQKILGKPLLHYVIERLKEANLKDIIIVTGSFSNQIKDHFKDGEELGVSIEYTYQKEALGMANALEAAKDLVDDNFFVINADDIFESDLLEKMYNLFKKSDAEIILSCKPVKETWKFGIVEVKEDKVTRIVEKPGKGKEPSNLAVIGTYILNKKIFDYYKKIPVSDDQFEKAIQKFIKDGNSVKVVKYDKSFLTYKYPWDLFSINEYLMNKYIKKQVIEEDVSISKKAYIEGNVWISKGAKILEGACIKGPCYIGKNTLIGNNVLIRNYSSIGDNCIVGFASEIKNSLIGDNCYFHTNYIGDSIISDNCYFGSGAVTANLRFDEKIIKVKIEDRKIDSGRNKLGVIMGENCRVGVNASIMPGIKIGPNSIVGPSVCLYEDLAQNEMIFIDKRSYVKKKR